MILQIKKLRNEKGITLDRLSTISGYSKSYLNELENYKKTPSLLFLLEEIASVLEVCPKDLLECNCEYCEKRRIVLEENIDELQQDRK